MKAIKIAENREETVEGRTVELPVPVPDDSSYRHGCESRGDADGS